MIHRPPGSPPRTEQRRRPQASFSRGSGAQVAQGPTLVTSPHKVFPRVDVWARVAGLDAWIPAAATSAWGLPERAQPHDAPPPASCGRPARTTDCLPDPDGSGPPADSRRPPQPGTRGRARKPPTTALVPPPPGYGSDGSGPAQRTIPPRRGLPPVRWQPAPSGRRPRSALIPGRPTVSAERSRAVTEYLMPASSARPLEAENTASVAVATKAGFRHEHVINTPRDRRHHGMTARREARAGARAQRLVRPAAVRGREPRVPAPGPPASRASGACRCPLARLRRPTSSR